MACPSIRNDEAIGAKPTAGARIWWPVGTWNSSRINESYTLWTTNVSDGTESRSNYNRIDFTSHTCLIMKEKLWYEIEQMSAYQATLTLTIGLHRTIARQDSIYRSYEKQGRALQGHTQVFYSSTTTTTSSTTQLKVGLETIITKITTTHQQHILKLNESMRIKQEPPKTFPTPSQPQR